MMPSPAARGADEVAQDGGVALTRHVVPMSARNVFNKLLVLGLSVTMPGFAQGAESARFRLEQTGERAAIVTPAGGKLFLLGLNHVGESAPRDPAARAAFVAEATSRMRQWGFNNLGYGTPDEARDALPFLAQLQLTQGSHYQEAAQFTYLDVFDPGFQRTTRETIQKYCAATAAHPNLIGYYWSDTPRWDIDLARRLRGDDWVSALRRRPAASAGKQAYVQFLRERYGNDPGRYAAAYRHAIATFDDLLVFDFREFDRSNPAGRADDELFLGRIARELYQVIGGAFREFAPGRLIFGERYKLHDHPDVVLREAAKWIDVLSIQPGPEVGPLPGPGRDETVFDATAFDRLHQVSGKPILICDHQVSFRLPAFPVTLWHQAPDVDSAAAILERFLLAAAAKPYVVGYQRCQYVDSFRTDRGNMLKQGLVAADGVPHPGLTGSLPVLHAAALKARGISPKPN
jgi:hypothetical protein